VLKVMKRNVRRRREGMQSSGSIGMHGGGSMVFDSSMSSMNND